MKRYISFLLRRCVVALFFLLSISDKASASHFYGADFFYTHASGSDYTITLVVYADCAGPLISPAFNSLPFSTPEVEIYNASSLISTVTLSVQSPSTGVEVTPVCPSQLGNTACTNASNSIPGVKKFVYTRTVTLGTSASWRFLFTGEMNNSQAGRSNNITNIQNPGNSLINLEATLNNLNAPNSSPVYTTIPTPFFCINKTASYNPGAVDPNNDNLAYALVAGMEPGTNVIYINPYTATAPLASATGTFNFSTTTGQLNFTPNLVQKSLVVNRVSEFRNNVLVGTSMREMTFVVLNNCNNRPPLGSISNANGGTINNSNTITACKSAGALSFQINPSDSDGNTINVVASGLPAGATFNITGNNTVSPSCAFSWNLAAVTPGTYNFFVTYTDNGCPLSSKQTQAYTIIIQPDPTVSFSYIALPTCVRRARFNITPGLSSPWTVSIYQGTTLLHNFPNITGPQTDSLFPGNYTIRVTNANGCYKDTLITIAQPPAIIPAASMTLPTCFGGNNGSITITATGGLSPFQYALGSGAYSSTNTFTGLSTGNYTFHIKDANDCVKDTTVFLQQPAEVSANITFTKPPCNFFNSGAITVNGINGVAPYQYALGAGAYSSTNTFSGLFSGSYVIHIRDSKGCTKDSTFILPDSVKVHASAILTHIMCNGASTGVITLNAYGATAPYQYQLGSGTLSTTNTFTGLPAGTHNFHIEDNNRCYLDTAIVLQQPTAIIPTSAVSNVLCNGQSNGSITVTPTGGNPPYTFAIGAGTYNSTNTFSGLGTGSYTIHVKDAYNCIKDTIIVITQPTVLKINNINLVTPDCYGYTNGTITITGGGGTTPYNYAVNTGFYQSSNFFNSLAAGNYMLHLKDANGCQVDSAVILNQPTELIANAQLKNSTCYPLNNGIVTLGGTGGTPAYTYAVGTGAYTSSPSFTALASGSYTFHVRDTRGCTKDTIINVIDSIVVYALATVTNAKCFNENSGSIVITPTAGIIPHTFALGSGAYSSNNSFANLVAGNYVIHTRDALGCIKDSNVNIGQPTRIQANANIKKISCNGKADGEITFLSSGGTPPYTFTDNIWGTFTPNNVFSNISAGQYKYYIRDANGCTIDTTILMQEPTSVFMTVVKTNVLCNGDTTGSVIVTGTGGTSPYTYYTSTGTPQTGNIITGLAAGIHIIFVEDANGCKTSQSVQLTQPASIHFDSVLVKNATCENYEDGSVSLNAKGGVKPYQYAMNSGSFSGTRTFSTLKEGSYTFYIKDSNACVHDTTLEVGGYPHIIVNEIISDSVRCYGNADGQILVNANGGNAPLTYKLINRPAVSTNLFSNLGAGHYTITITDRTNCKKDTSAIIETPAEINILVNITPNDCQGHDNTGKITTEVSGGTSPYNYLWSNESTSHELTGMANGVYKLYVTDANSCKDSALADIKYDDCCQIFIPNGFTPNNDGINDKAKVLFKGDFKLKIFAIYNRFGQQVFATDIIMGKESEGWDGRLNGVIQDIGTFNYYVKGICGNSNNKDVEYKGTITLIK